MGKRTPADQIISKIKNHPISSIVVFFAIITGGIAYTLTSIDQIWTFVEKRLINATSETEGKANRSDLSSTAPEQNDKLSSEQLNVLVLDATDSKRIFDIVVRELKREYPNWFIDAEYDWVEKERNPRSRTLILWQGKENEKHARSLEKRFSGPQELRSYDDNPGGFFGFDEDRDLIVFIGRDWRNVLNGLRQPDNSPPPSPD